MENIKIAVAGFEPTIMESKSNALPLGHTAEYNAHDGSRTRSLTDFKSDMSASCITWAKN